jgi:hypothetical protein
VAAGVVETLVADELVGVDVISLPIDRSLNTLDKLEYSFSLLTSLKM